MISKILQEKYEGDPRNITPESTSLEEDRRISTPTRFQIEQLLH